MPTSEKTRWNGGREEYRGHRHKTREFLLLLLLICSVLFTWDHSRHAALPNRCSPPLPELLAEYPIDTRHRSVVAASVWLNAYFTLRASASDIDSISVAIVTPFGPVFERSYGALKANETDPGVVDSDSIYRIASITKMFTVLETLILREKGLLSWDDPVTKFVPEFTYPSNSWIDILEGKKTHQAKQKKAPITLRQLASHLSGIGRDFPGLDFENWPHVPLEAVELNMHTKSYNTSGWDGPAKDIISSIAKTPLVAAPYSFPVYSNTGMDLLGLSNLGAERIVNKTTATHNDMVERDIFKPLGLNSSFYGRPEGSFARHLAVPSINSEYADFVFNVSSDASGGQYSSLVDLSKVMQSFLAPSANNGVVPEYVIREWLRPLHGWSDGFLEVGAPWEIIKLQGQPGVRIFSKGGNLPGYHSHFSLNPLYSYGVIVLVTGTYADTVTHATDVITHFQPVFEELLVERVIATYAGIWVGKNTFAVIDVIDNVMRLRSLIINGVNILDLLSAGKPAALWSTGRYGEFRIAFGRPEINDTPFAGCEPYWISIDTFKGRGAPTDLLYFSEGNLVYPSANARMSRLAGE